MTVQFFGKKGKQFEIKIFNVHALHHVKQQYLFCQATLLESIYLVGCNQTRAIKWGKYVIKKNCFQQTNENKST